ncbi:MAG TPA: MFS transporter [Gaiellaceae bacterium]|nr:MFS transporter [Gaiellaceae bacterium]
MGIRRPTGGLWSHGDFLKLWSAETISQFGTQVSQLALPLVAILVLDASAFAVSALVTIEFLPFILFSLPAGVWVDRLRRKPILVLGDVGRAVLLASVPVAYVADAVTIWQLYVVGFGVGVCTVFFDVAYQSYLPSLVERGQLVDGNAKLELSRSAAQIGGPGFAGGLVSALTAPYAVLVDAVSYVGSALFLFTIRKPEPLPEAEAGTPRPSMLREAREGLRYVLGNRYLRAIAACTGSSNLFGSMVFAIYLVYAVRTLDLSPGVIGVVLGVANVGTLGAALLSARISRRLGVGPTIVLMAGIFGPAMLLIPLAPASMPIPFLVAAGLLFGFSVVVYNITQVSFRQAITPERMQGRMNSVMRFIVWGVMPLGSLLGGALGTWIGLRETMWLAAIGGSFTFLPVLLSPVRSLREMPEPHRGEPVVSDLEAGLVSGLHGPLTATDESRA